jgi:hypothetical protein
MTNPFFLTITDEYPNSKWLLLTHWKNILILQGFTRCDEFHPVNSHE